MTLGGLWSDNSSASVGLYPNNTTDGNGSVDHEEEWLLVRSIIPPYIFTLSALGLLGNGFVLLVFLVQKDRLNVPEIYLGNLALADLALLICLPFWAMNIRHDFNWPYGEALCKIVNSSAVLNFYTSVSVVATISVDRYLALVQTMRARWLRRTRYAKAVCAATWLLGLLMSAPSLAHRTVAYVEELNTTACILDYGPLTGVGWRLAHQIAMNFLGFVCPVLIIALSSGAVVRALNRRRKEGEVGGVGGRGGDRKATTLVYTVTLLFLLCWGPFQLFTFLDTLCELSLLDEAWWGHTLDIGHQVSVYVAFSNSVLNPALYVFSGQYFRRKVMRSSRSYITSETHGA
ncbi:hypothetical protein CRUP_010105 [Coryphaenoides rupestris]|nr:hypothetical protein CRUP_010105 [Coryphaenoides rupestris]